MIKSLETSIDLSTKDRSFITILRSSFVVPKEKVSLTLLITLFSLG